jgi:hypothetical protein
VHESAYSSRNSTRFPSESVMVPVVLMFLRQLQQPRLKVSRCPIKLTYGNSLLPQFHLRGFQFLIICSNQYRVIQRQPFPNAAYSSTFLHAMGGYEGNGGTRRREYRIVSLVSLASSAGIVPASIFTLSFSHLSTQLVTTSLLQ